MPCPPTPAHPHPPTLYVGLHVLPSSGILQWLPGGKSKLYCTGVRCNWATKCHFLVKPNSSHASEDSDLPQRQWCIYNPHAHMIRRVSAWLCRQRPCRSSAAAGVFISEQTHSCKLTFLPVWHLRLVFISPGNLTGRLNESLCLFITHGSLLAGNITTLIYICSFWLEYQRAILKTFETKTISFFMLKQIKKKKSAVRSK